MTPAPPRAQYGNADPRYTLAREAYTRALTAAGELDFVVRAQRAAMPQHAPPCIAPRGHQITETIYRCIHVYKLRSCANKITPALVAAPLPTPFQQSARYAI